MLVTFSTRKHSKDQLIEPKTHWHTNTRLYTKTQTENCFASQKKTQSKRQHTHTLKHIYTQSQKLETKEN